MGTHHKPSQHSAAQEDDCGYELINTDVEEVNGPYHSNQSYQPYTLSSVPAPVHLSTNKTLSASARINADSPASLGPADLLYPVRTGNEEKQDKNRDSLSRYSPTPSTITTSTTTGMRPPGFHRVSSFAAFESPPLYSLPKNDRKGGRLKQERRKLMATTQEYQELRLSFCKETISSALLKLARSKGTH
eukprot:GDKK01051698.1.p1 GENE.GDKK01051698.1~~GDKK01051698.1.p1  ORF type:complete len:189 (-),score=20.65 GDKK01051698.1:608-1174(-)